MTLLSYFSGKTRRSGPNPTTDAKARMEYWSSRLGTPVTEEEALSLSTFYAGKTLIASTVAGLPLHVYRDDKDGTPVRQREKKHYYLWGDPNEEQTRMTFLERVIGDEVSKAAYIWVEKDDLSEPKALWHIERHRITLTRHPDNGHKVYVLDGEFGMYDYNQGGEIVHVPNWGSGPDGWDIVKGGARSFGLSLTAEEFATKAFDYGAVPPGIINLEGDPSPDAEKESAAMARVRDQWTMMRGGTNALKVAVLRGAKYQQLAFDPEKLQMEQIRKFQAGEIATLLGVPPHMVGLVDKSSSWGAGIAEQTAGFNTFTLSRHIARFEHAINKFLLRRELTDLYCKFDLGGLLRGTLLQRYQAYAIGYGRFLSVNDIRRDEDLPPVEGGDAVFGQMQMVPIDELTKLGAMPPEEPKPAEDSDDNEDEDEE